MHETLSEHQLCVGQCCPLYTSQASVCIALADHQREPVNQEHWKSTAEAVQIIAVQFFNTQKCKLVTSFIYCVCVFEIERQNGVKA